MTRGIPRMLHEISYKTFYSVLDNRHDKLLVGGGGGRALGISVIKVHTFCSK